MKLWACGVLATALLAPTVVHAFSQCSPVVTVHGRGEFSPRRPPFQKARLTTFGPRSDKDESITLQGRRGWPAGAVRGLRVASDEHDRSRAETRGRFGPVVGALRRR